MKDGHRSAEFEHQVILPPSAFILCSPYRTGLSGMIGFPSAVTRGVGFQAWP